MYAQKKGLVKFIKNIMQHYNHQKYWKYRQIVTDPKNKTLKIIKLYFLCRIKKMDFYANASMGTDLHSGAYFETPPRLPHHLNGIIISHHAKIGKNSVIFQQVTIADDPHKENTSAQIGDNVLIGAGAKIIGNVKIGNNVKIGANAVVVKDVPDNVTVVGVPAKIVRKRKK